MGICKCRKRSDLFCWHCQKAVCTDCVIDEEHNLAHVGTYSEWLENPNVVPQCPLSGKTFSPQDEVIRFMNMQIFLLSAIDEYGKNKPANTALAGFTIPGTQERMVPPALEKSLLAQQIRQKLSKFPWISALIKLQAEGVEEAPQPTPEGPPAVGTNGVPPSGMPDANPHLPVSPTIRKVSVTPSKRQSEDLVIDIDSTPTHSSRPRTTETEEDKYKRRPIRRAFEALGILTPANSGLRGASGYNLTGKRLILILALVSTLFIVLFLSFSLEETANDPTVIIGHDGKDNTPGNTATKNTKSEEQTDTEEQGEEGEAEGEDWEWEDDDPADGNTEGEGQENDSDDNPPPSRPPPSNPPSKTPSRPPPQKPSRPTVPKPVRKAETQKGKS